jgi:hypothetical protein
MTKRLLDYDPLSGQTTHFEYVEDGDAAKMVLTYSYDVQAGLDLAQSLANDEDRTRKGIKEDLWHYAHIPAGVAMEMLVKHGVDINNPHHKQAVFKLLNTEYTKCKTTTLMHNIKHG